MGTVATHGSGVTLPDNAIITNAFYDVITTCQSADTGGGVGSEAIAPEFNVVGDSGINQLAQLQQQPTQAFVVSGEVTSAQALDRNRVTNATL